MNPSETVATEPPAPGDSQPSPNGKAVTRSVRATHPQSIPMLQALLYAPFRPAWVAQRTTDLSLKRAWFVHFLSALALFAIVCLALLWAAWPALDPNPIAKIVGDAQREIGFLVDEFHRYPIESTLSVLGIIALVEGVHVLVALVFMPWGARDEPLRKSFGFSVRQTWLAGSRLILAALILGGPLAYVLRQDQTWRNANPGPPQANITWPKRPTLSETDPNYARAKADFDAAFSAALAQSQSQWTARTEWLATRPWLLRNPHVVGVPLGILAALWFLWALLRSIGATRNVPPIAHDGRCIECGYNLHTIPMESRCPECGKPVIESLGPGVHPGTVWEHRKPGGTLRAWWRSAIDVARTPRAFGQALRVGDPSAAHRRFLGISLVAIWLVATGAILTMFCLFMNPGDFAAQPELFLLIPPAFGTLCLAGTLVVACGGAAAVGLTQSLTYARNLLPAAMQVASYLGGFLLLWAVFGAMLVLTLQWMDRSYLLRGIATLIGTRTDVVGTLVFCVPNVAFAAFFLRRLAVATAATRHANR